jgi:hypothetical protein
VLRSFRPVLLGVAGATAWLALSATAASADAGTDYDRLLGGLASTIPSVSASAPEPAKPGAQPPAGGLSGAVGRTIELLPAATHVDPAQTPVTLVSPAVALVGASVVDPVLPAVTEVAPVTAPILAPPTEVMTGPSPIPALAPVPVPALDARPDLGDSTTPLPSVAARQTDVAAPLATSPSAAFQAPAPGGTGAPGQSPGGGDTPPAVPGSGSGSQNQSGTSGPVALESRPFQLNALTGAVPIGGPLQHAPQPVSFDPGSSPD